MCITGGDIAGGMLIVLIWQFFSWRKRKKAEMERDRPNAIYFSGHPDVKGTYFNVTYKSDDDMLSFSNFWGTRKFSIKKESIIDVTTEEDQSYYYVIITWSDGSAIHKTKFGWWTLIDEGAWKSNRFKSRCAKPYKFESF